jgi:hypothetical protein
MRTYREKPKQWDLVSALVLAIPPKIYSFLCGPLLSLCPLCFSFSKALSAESGISMAPDLTLRLQYCMLNP